METLNSIKLIQDFKNKHWGNNISTLKDGVVEKKKSEIREPQIELFNAAIEIKKASTQINEIIHAVGIINSLPKILLDDEIVKSVSLAAGITSERFDLVTNRRIAEFKFSEWNGKKDGSRRRHMFSDYVNLLIYETEKQKELYVFSYAQVSHFLNNSNAQWNNILSKSGNIREYLSKYLESNYPNKKEKIKTVSEIVKLENIKIIDLEKI